MAVSRQGVPLSKQLSVVMAIGAFRYVPLSAVSNPFVKIVKTLLPATLSADR